MVTQGSAVFPKRAQPQRLSRPAGTLECRSSATSDSLHPASDTMSYLVHVLSDDTEFDLIFLKHLREEGFNTIYTPFTGDIRTFKYTIQHLADDLEQGQKYAIIAFGEAATHALSVARDSALPHCVSLVCYYPTAVTSPTHKYPASLSLLCHLASIQPFGTASFKTYVYPDVYPGFAESDLQEYDKFAAGLSWARTLACLRRSFGIVIDLEQVVDEYEKCKFVDYYFQLRFDLKTIH